MYTFTAFEFMNTNLQKKEIDKENLIELFSIQCSDSTVGTEWSFHQLSPYIGKIKSTIARFLIENFTPPGAYVCDPFCGAGTIPFEAWSLNRNVIANDLNKYAHVLTLAKLFPPYSLETVLPDIERFDKIVQRNKQKVDLRRVPKWVRDFFHKETLRETIAWFEVLGKNNSHFLLACILGILHHQRPGFLSFPSSHTVPYLRTKSFPREKYPQLYQYRSVKDRLIKKAKRAFKRIPRLNENIERKCYTKDARSMDFKNIKVDAIVSSPPYMRKLDYARDNRLRLWFLGINDSKKMDEIISPKEFDFIKMMKECLIHWKSCLAKKGKCILFLGDNYSKKYKMNLPEVIENIATKEIGGYELLFKHISVIPQNRRVRRNYRGNKSETILILRKK